MIEGWEIKRKGGMMMLEEGGRESWQVQTKVYNKGLFYCVNIWKKSPGEQT